MSTVELSKVNWNIRQMSVPTAKGRNNFSEQALYVKRVGWNSRF
jgi:hypothetical protein